MKLKLSKRDSSIAVVIFAIYATLTYYTYCYIGSRAEQFKQDCLHYYANVVEKILLTNVKIIAQTINNNDSDDMIEIIVSIIRNDVYLYNNGSVIKVAYNKKIIYHKAMQ